jgi:hypothetical protein
MKTGSQNQLLVEFLRAFRKLIGCCKQRGKEGAG